jgi:hypothetical protein
MTPGAGSSARLGRIDAAHSDRSGPAPSCAPARRSSSVASRDPDVVGGPGPRFGNRRNR